MTKLKLFALYWLPIVLWIAVIFSASGDTKSVKRSSRLIEPLVRWLFPDASDETIWSAVLVVRKTAHLTEYAILASLAWRVVRGKQTGWQRRHALNAWLIATGVAMLDEYYQTFVPGRQGVWWDVMIDSIGAACGLFSLWCVGRWRKWW